MLSYSLIIGKVISFCSLGNILAWTDFFFFSFLSFSLLFCCGVLAYLPCYFYFSNTLPGQLYL